jgi:hypothetical protein
VVRGSLAFELDLKRNLLANRVKRAAVKLVVSHAARGWSVQGACGDTRVCGLGGGADWGGWGTLGVTGGLGVAGLECVVDDPVEALHGLGRRPGRAGDHRVAASPHHTNGAPLGAGAQAATGLSPAGDERDALTGEENDLKHKIGDCGIMFRG